MLGHQRSSSLTLATEEGMLGKEMILSEMNIRF